MLQTFRKLNGLWSFSVSHVNIYQSIFQRVNELCFKESSVSFPACQKIIRVTKLPAALCMCRSKVGIVWLTDECFLLDNLYEVGFCSILSETLTSDFSLIPPKLLKRYFQASIPWRSANIRSQQKEKIYPNILGYPIIIRYLHYWWQRALSFASASLVAPRTVALNSSDLF